MTTTDRILTPRRLQAMERNLLCHFSFLPRHGRGMAVAETKTCLLVDSGLPSDSFNIVYCRAPWRASCRTALAEAIDRFRARRLPFTVWVSPAALDVYALPLRQLGLKPDQEVETGMVLQPDRFAPPRRQTGLTIRRVANAADLRAFARVLASGSSPEHAAVYTQFFRRTQGAILAAGCPVRLLIGFCGREPVSTCEALIAQRGAGIYCVHTHPAHRRQGYATALVAHAVQEAFSAGCRFVGLQAGTHAQGIYARLGFQECCRFALYN